MTSGIRGTGPYSRKRELENRLRVQKQHLANAPLGPRQKKVLECEIAEIERDLKAVRKEIRDAKPA